MEKLPPVIDKASRFGPSQKNLPLAIARGPILIELERPSSCRSSALCWRAAGFGPDVVARPRVGRRTRLTAFASFDDSGVVALLLAPLLLIAGALSLVPAAIGPCKARAPTCRCSRGYEGRVCVTSRAAARRPRRRVRLAPALEARAPGRVDGVRGGRLLASHEEAEHVSGRRRQCSRAPPRVYACPRPRPSISAEARLGAQLRAASHGQERDGVAAGANRRVSWASAAGAPRGRDRRDRRDRAGSDAPRHRALVASAARGFAGCV